MFYCDKSKENRVSFSKYLLTITPKRGIFACISVLCFNTVRVTVTLKRIE